MRIYVLKKSSVIRTVVFVLLIACALVYTTVVLNKDISAFNEGETDLMPICRVDTQDKNISLTIDTAFGEDYTEEILSVLKENDVKATFCVLGMWAEKNPELIKAIVADGHEIISHSMNHERYPDLEETQVVEDATAAREYLKQTASVDTPYIRMPYGAFDNMVMNALESNGFIPIKWSLDSKDWEGNGAEEIVKRVTGNLTSGDIVMFQNNVKDTPEALKTLLPMLKQNGYQVVPLDTLVLKGDYTVDQNGLQTQKNASQNAVEPSQTAQSIAPSPSPSVSSAPSQYTQQ